MADERRNLFVDLLRETADSWHAMPLAARVSLVVGFIGFLVSAGIDWSLSPRFALASLRIAFLIAMLFGIIGNARALDEFYQRVHLYACAYALVGSCVALYAASEFGIDLGSRAITVFIAAWGIGFLVSFGVLRRG